MRLHPGEIEASGWRVHKLSEVLRRLRDASPGVTGRPRVIAVDGRGGAGKSTLVDRLLATVPRSAVVHTDDIAWNQAYFDWGQLLIENVLRPIHRGDAVNWRPPAWIAHDRPGAISVPAGADIVWIEGTGIIRQEFAPWLDATVWMQADLDEQDRRLTARDGTSNGDGWLAQELPLLLREQPWKAATITVAGASDLDHDPRTEIVVADPHTPDRPAPGEQRVDRPRPRSPPHSHLTGVDVEVVEAGSSTACTAIIRPRRQGRRSRKTGTLRSSTVAS